MNPRPTLMLSQIFSFLPSHAHLQALGCLAYRHMWMKCDENTLALSTTSCNLITNTAPDNTKYCTHIHKVNNSQSVTYSDKYFFSLSDQWELIILAQEPSYTDTCLQLHWQSAHLCLLSTLSVCLPHLPRFFINVWEILLNHSKWAVEVVIKSSITMHLRWISSAGQEPQGGTTSETI